MQVLSPFLVAGETAAVVAGFPLWWYGDGLRGLLRFLWDGYAPGRRLLRLRVMAEHLFVPLFGDGTWEMRVISVGIRIPLTLGLAVWAVIGAALFLLILLLWVALPPVALLALLAQWGLDLRFS